MSSLLAERRFTVDEFLDLPENGRDRMLIRGELWDRPMTYRNPVHSAVMMQLGYLLQVWLKAGVELPYKVLGGEAGFRLGGEPGSVVGIDVAVAAKNQPKYVYKNRVVLEGPPVLAAEILSPSDRQRDIQAKVDEYLDVGVPLVWVIDPHFLTVTVHRPGSKPVMFTEGDELVGEPVLQGLRLMVSQIFETM